MAIDDLHDASVTPSIAAAAEPAATTTDHMYNGADTSDSDSSSIDSASLAAPAPVALALVVGAVLFALTLYTRRAHRRRSATSASAAPTAAAALSQTHTSALSDQHTRCRTYIQHKIAAHDVVVFVGAANRNATWSHFQTLLYAVLAPLRVANANSVAFVDLETTAQGGVILAVLQELAMSPRTTMASTKMFASSRGATLTMDARSSPVSPSKLTEFMFVRGALVGDYCCVRQLLLADTFAETLAHLGLVLPTATAADVTTSAFAMDAVHIDRTSDAGFVVLGPRQCVLSVRNDKRAIGSQDDADVHENKWTDPLVETRPLDSVDALWRHCDDERVIASTMRLPRVPLAERARHSTRRSRLLVCHDMQGGYLSDRFTQGDRTPTALNAYRFYQWDLVDVFVYFGHHLVCIPPSGWIAAGHRNGTRVLGAFVLEGDSGSEVAAALFVDRATAEQSATHLAAIAALYGFDGYLINIESDVGAAHVPHVLAFLTTLRAALHAHNANAHVVWYATLAARTGKRYHGRRLDSDAALFFRCVDGLFVDYGWTLADAACSAASDLDRRFDVYMGIDVFGRHDTLGGGKLACDVALRAAWNAGVSAALFAPGWTHECLRHDTHEDVVVVEDRFWTIVRSVWKAQSPCFSALGGRDSLYSAFNVGRGTNVYVDGKAMVAAPHAPRTWSNVMEMDRQPIAALHAGVPVQTMRNDDATLRAVITHATAFQGGACVAIVGRMRRSAKMYVKLFDVDIALSARHVTEVSYTTAQPIDGSVALLVLTLCPGLDRRASHQVILRSEVNDVRSDSSNCDSSSRQRMRQDSTGVTGTSLSTAIGVASGKTFYAPVWTRTYGSHNSNMDTDTNAGAGVEGGAGADVDTVHLKDGRLQQHVWVKKTYRLGGMLWDAKHIVEIGVLCTTRKDQKKDDKDEGTDTGADDADGHADIGVNIAQRAYHACVGEVCVASGGSSSKGNGGNDTRTGHSSRARGSGTIAATPRACAHASVRDFQRLDDDHVSFSVQWTFTDRDESDVNSRGGSSSISSRTDSSSSIRTNGGDAAVRYVLAYLCDRRSRPQGATTAGATTAASAIHRVLLGKSFGTSFTVERCQWRRKSSAAAASTLLHLELVSVSWTGTRASDADICNVYLSENDGAES